MVAWAALASRAYGLALPSAERAITDAERAAVGKTPAGANAMTAKASAIIAALEELARDTPSEALVGEIERCKTVALVNLMLGRTQTQHADRLLDIAEAASRMGISKDWLYRHANTFPFARRIGRKVLFSDAGLVRWLANRSR